MKRLYGVFSWVQAKMPEMVASNSSQRFCALLDFQRDLDLLYPSHMGNKNVDGEGFSRPRHSDSCQRSWSDTLSGFLSSSLRLSKADAAPPARPCGVEAARNVYPSTLARSQGQFSPQKLIRIALKRAFSVDGSVTNVKRARFEGCNSIVEPMVCG